MECFIQLTLFFFNYEYFDIRLTYLDMGQGLNDFFPKNVYVVRMFKLGYDHWWQATWNDHNNLLKKNDPAEWKISVKILEFRDQINLVDAIATTVLQIGKDFYVRFYEGSTFNVEINT